MSRKRPPALSPDYAALLGVEAQVSTRGHLPAREVCTSANLPREAPRPVKVTVSLDAALVAQVRAAVASLPRSYTFAGLVAEALRRELARLDKQHGPFPAQAAPLRPGRPVGR